MYIVRVLGSYRLDGCHSGIIRHTLRESRHGQTTIFHPDFAPDLSSFRSSHPLHAPARASRLDQPHWDTLDKSLVVFRLPTEDESSAPRLHRRVDLICPPIETYWTAIVGWYACCMSTVPCCVRNVARI